MSNKYLSIASTPSVKAAQGRYGSRRSYARLDDGAAEALGNESIGPAEAEFIATRDLFYLASVSETGWPYVQFRGGPPGFLRVLDTKTLGYADFRGNRQYISAGNIDRNDRVSLFLMDYPHQRRMKIFAHAEVRPADEASELLRNLTPEGHKAVIERAVIFHIEAFDWNCPQHITPRFTPDEWNAVLQPIRTKLATLEAENERLRSQIAAFTSSEGR